MFKRLSATVALCAVLAVAVAACGSDDSDSGSGGNGEVSVAYVNPYIANGYQISYECGMIDAADKNPDVNLSVSGSSAFSPDVQIPVVEAAAAKSPDALITAATDSDALAAPLRQISESGTTVVVYDTLLNDDSIAASQIGSDNYGGGVQIGEALAEALGGEGKVLPIDLNPGVKSTNDRAKGVLDTLAKHPGIEVLDTQYDELDPQKSASIVESALSANPDLSAIVPMYNDGAIAAMAALRSRGELGKIPIYTFDADPRIVKAVKDGNIEAVSSQQPYKQAEESLDITLKAVDGEDVEKEVLTPMKLLDRSNIDDPASKSAIYVSKRCA